MNKIELMEIVNEEMLLAEGVGELLKMTKDLAKLSVQKIAKSIRTGWEEFAQSIIASGKEDEALAIINKKFKSNYKNLNQLLNLDSLKLNSDYYSELRNNMQFLTIDEFNPKSPLNTENSTYMGVDTEILKSREINEYYSDIQMYIKSGIFEKNTSYFQWLEEIIICLIYRKDDEELLKELVKLHKYWYRHFKIMAKSDM